MKKSLFLIAAILALTGCSTTPTPPEEVDDFNPFATVEAVSEPVYTMGNNSDSGFYVNVSYCDLGRVEYNVRYHDGKYECTHAYSYVSSGEAIESFLSSTEHSDWDTTYVANNMYFAYLEQAPLDGFNASLSKDEQYNVFCEQYGAVTSPIVGESTYSPNSVESEYLRASVDKQTLTVGESVQVNIDHAPSTDFGYLYTSDDELVASVSEDGTVTGVGSGSTVITVRTEDGSYSSQIAITVE